MSLLNDMLRDLDARRSRPEGLDALALQGVGPSLARRAPALPLGRLVLGIALAVGLAAGGIQAWSLRAPTLPDTPAPVLPDRALPAEVAASDAHALPVEAPALVTDTQAMAPEPITAPVLPKHAPRPAVAPVPRAEPPARTSPATAAVATVPARDATTYKNIRALAPAEQAQQTFEQGAAALRQGRAERAQALLQETLDLMPTHSQARLALAGLWVRQQRIEPALDLLARGLALVPVCIACAVICCCSRAASRRHAAYSSPPRPPPANMPTTRPCSALSINALSSMRRRQRITGGPWRCNRTRACGGWAWGCRSNRPSRVPPRARPSAPRAVIR
jgi:hypothetical protein